MDELYANLENYHDDKIINELKDENKDLKSKLEDYSNAMGRLQNDFDKLNSEYKKLEMNYSSLLKTARAEIERKSDLIKSLNLQKDQLVIEAMRTTGINILKNIRHKLNDIQQPDKKYEINSEYADESQQKKDELDNNIVDKNLRNHRVNSIQAQSEGTPSSMDNHSNFSDDSRKSNNYHKNNVHKTKVYDSKYIHSEDFKCFNSREHRNSNTQKFIRQSRVEPIYSSDDDIELHFKNTRKSSSKEDTGYKSHYNREKYLSPSRDLYKNSTDRHDKYRHSRYDLSDRKYRRHSPQKYKDDNTKEKKLRIPSPDKYSSKCRDRRFISEREQYLDNARNLSYHGVKHKIRNELEEPTSKRHKLEENTASSDKSRHSKDREKVNLSKHNLTELSSCQSTEYDNVDSTLPLHEIKKTTSFLEDLRVSSQKNDLKTDAEKKNPAVVCKIIDIKRINVPKCEKPNIKKVSSPEVLNHNELSTVTRKDLVSDININIDKTTLNSQIDSEKIQKDINKCTNLQPDTKICGKITVSNKSKDESETTDNVKGSDSNKLQKLFSDGNKYKIRKRDHKSDHTNIMNYDCEKPTKEDNHNIDKKGSKPTITTKPESSNIKKVSDDNRQIEIIQKTSYKLIQKKTVVALSTLADDLELSDEANEIKDSQKDKLVCNKILKKNNDSACVVSVEVNEHQSDLPLVKDKHSEPKDISDLVNSKKEIIKQCHQGNNKTAKLTKKTAQKENNTKPNEQSHTILECKDKEQKHFSIQTKNKFSDLFGDSSSLITPEDLGIPAPEILPLDDKYVSVFENTQDAVDLNVVKENYKSTKISTFPINLKELSTDKTVVEQTDNALNILLPKESDKNATVTNNSVNLLYNKIEPERFNSSSEVVKTLIISSGVQPITEYVPLNNKLQNNEINFTEFPNIIHEDKNNLKKCVMSDIKALATSTPNKFIHQNVSLPISDLNGQHYSDKITEEMNVSSNTSNSLKQIINDADIPDLRIIVKRRRKIIKKP